MNDYRKTKLKNLRYMDTQPDCMHTKREHKYNVILTIAVAGVYLASLVALLWGATQLPDKYFDLIDGAHGVFGLIGLYLTLFILVTYPFVKK